MTPTNRGHLFLHPGHKDPIWGLQQSNWKQSFCLSGKPRGLMNWTQKIYICTKGKVNAAGTQGLEASQAHNNSRKSSANTFQVIRSSPAPSTWQQSSYNTSSNAGNIPDP
eukprot:1158011-Pelagomonas_calceolata.AAC.1